METVARRMLDTFRIDPTRMKNCLMLRSKIFSDDANHADFRKEAGSQCKMCGSAAQATIDGAVGRLDTIECNRTNYENRHRCEFFPKQNLCDSIFVIQLR
jgi:hypothetical protein